MSYPRAFLFFLLSVFYVQTAKAVDDQYIVDISQINSSQHLASEALIYHDPLHLLSADSVLKNIGIYEQVFKEDEDIPYMDFTTSTYWMKLPIENTASVKKTFYIQLARPLTNKVRLHVFNQQNEKIVTLAGGDQLPFKDRIYQHREFIFPFTFKAKTRYTLVVETTSDGEILKLPIKFWTVNDFTQFTSKENFYLGLYYGTFILVVILFSFFGIALKQKVYLYFVSYVFFLGLFQFSLDGMAYQFFWPKNPWLGNHAILILAATSLFCMLMYIRLILDFKLQSKWYQRVYYFFVALGVICLALSFTEGPIYSLIFPVLNALSLFIIFYVILGIILRYKLGKHPDPSISIAFAFLCLGAIFFILSNVNIIPNEFLANNALKLGSGAEVTFLSLAMASRYRRTQNEKIEAQKEANKRLEEINALKSEQTERLEQQVKERTQEVVLKNEQLSEQNKEIINSINYAKRLQDAILPSDKVFIHLFKDSSVLYLPKDIVSGDFYWIEETEDRIFFAVADCTGHGVPGAMVSVLGHNSLNRCIKEYNLTDPGKILDSVTELVVNTLSKKGMKVNDGMDISLCVWDKKDRLYFAGAYNPIYLLRNEELIEYKADKQPIGRYDNSKPFTTKIINLEKGDSFYLFSDGYADQFGGPRGKKLKYANFKKYLLELNHLSSTKIKDNLHERFTEWRANEAQIDDVCVMNVKF